LKHKYTQLQKRVEKWYSIEELYRLAGKHGFKLQVYLSLDDKKAFDVIFYRNLDEEIKNAAYKHYKGYKIDREFSNNPNENFLKQKIDINKLQEFLSEKLPAYMIPTFFVELDIFPLNTSGKIDKKALPDPELKGDEDNYVAPRNDLEKELCKIYQEILGIDKIGISDDFFRLGGNSILALQLIYKMNKTLKSDLKVSQLFSNPRICEIVAEIGMEDVYKPLISFNKVSTKLPNLFMIHPGWGGCEVYRTLAKSLRTNFNCFGIDNYNLYNDKKIKNLTELSKYYLDHIKQKVKPDQQYFIFGWSLGAHIAINVALLSEEEGITNINLVLLDPGLPDKHVITQNKKIDKTKLYKIMKNDMIKEGYEAGYMERVAAVIPIEEKMSETLLPNNKLIGAKILVFKALNLNPILEGSNYAGISEYFLQLPFNNVDKYCSKENLTKVELDCHHRNILDKGETIKSSIIEWMNKIT
jgi:pimeloyl-ACP methyl ester carboxylesterase